MEKKNSCIILSVSVFNFIIPKSKTFGIESEYQSHYHFGINEKKENAFINIEMNYFVLIQFIHLQIVFEWRDRKKNGWLLMVYCVLGPLISCQTSSVQSNATVTSNIQKKSVVRGRLFNGGISLNVIVVLLLNIWMDVSAVEIKSTFFDNIRYRYLIRGCNSCCAFSILMTWQRDIYFKIPLPMTPKPMDLLQRNHKHRLNKKIVWMYQFYNHVKCIP